MACCWLTAWSICCTLRRTCPSSRSRNRGWYPLDARRAVALTLIAATVAAFVVLALAIWGVPGLVGAWPILAIGASVVSLALLIAFWDTPVVLGVVIDLALITLAVTQPAWIQDIAG